MKVNLFKKKRRKHHRDYLEPQEHLPKEFSQTQELMTPDIIYEETKEKNMIKMFMYE